MRPASVSPDCCSKSHEAEPSNLPPGASLEAGNAWLDRSDIGWKGLRTGSSLFVGADTGLGPLYLSLVHAPKGYTGLYLFLGRP